MLRYKGYKDASNVVVGNESYQRPLYRNFGVSSCTSSGVSTNGYIKATLKTYEADVARKWDIIGVPQVMTTNGDFLKLLVVDVTDSTTYLVIAINNGRSGNHNVPSLSSSTQLYVIGNIESALEDMEEGDTPNNVYIDNYCQTFCSILNNSQLAVKEGDVNNYNSIRYNEFLCNYAQNVERAFIYGYKKKCDYIESNPLYFTGGLIDRQAEEALFNYKESDKTSYGLDNSICLAVAALKGATEVILLANTALMGYLDAVYDNFTPVSKYGVDMKRVDTIFGTLYVVHDPVLNFVENPQGVVIDLDRIEKYCYEPTNTGTTRNKATGIEQLVYRETSCVMPLPNSVATILGEPMLEEDEE